MGNRLSVARSSKNNSPKTSKANSVGMASKSCFLDATLLRRSYIDIKMESTISDARIEEIVKHAILHCPTAFSVQSTRAVVQLHKDHDKLWDMIHEHAKKSFPPDLFEERITPNLKATKGSYGTVSQ